MSYKYYAFVSYNHKDVKTAQWLHSKLENFRLPSEIHNEIDAQQKYIRPVFRDKDELNAGILENELRDKLEASKYLIVICSQNSAKSEWVSNEVKAFIEMGRIDRIIPLLLEDGTDALPRSLKEYVAANLEMELLGVSIPEVGKEKAFVRIVSKMLDVSFDSIWNRHRRQQARKRIVAAVASVFVLAAVAVAWYINKPKDVAVRVSESGYVNTALPEINNLIVSLNLGSEVKTDTMDVVGGRVVFRNIPARMIGTEVHISVNAPHCNSVDTILSLKSDIDVFIARNVDTYGHISVMLFDSERGCGLAGRHVTVAGVEMVTGPDGNISLDIPIEKQAAYYTLSSSDSKLVDSIVYMPCPEISIVEAK